MTPPTIQSTIKPPKAASILNPGNVLAPFWALASCSRCFMRSRSRFAHGSSEERIARPSHATGAPPGPGSGIRMTPAPKTRPPTMIVAHRLILFTVSLRLVQQDGQRRRCENNIRATSTMSSMSRITIKSRMSPPMSSLPEGLLDRSRSLQILQQVGACIQHQGGVLRQ